MVALPGEPGRRASLLESLKYTLKEVLTTVICLHTEPVGETWRSSFTWNFERQANGLWKRNISLSLYGTWRKGSVTGDLEKQVKKKIYRITGYNGRTNKRAYVHWVFKGCKLLYILFYSVVFYSRTEAEVCHLTLAPLSLLKPFYRIFVNKVQSNRNNTASFFKNSE
jgi:hypothetical protein